MDRRSGRSVHHLKILKKARVGLVHFSTNVNDVFEINQHGDIRSILSAIENLQYKESHSRFFMTSVTTRNVSYSNSPNVNGPWTPDGTLKKFFLE